MNYINIDLKANVCFRNKAKKSYRKRGVSERKEIRQIDSSSENKTGGEIKCVKTASLDRANEKKRRKSYKAQPV